MNDNGRFFISNALKTIATCECYISCWPEFCGEYAWGQPQQHRFLYIFSHFFCMHLAHLPFGLCLLCQQTVVGKREKSETNRQSTHCQAYRHVASITSQTNKFLPLGAHRNTFGFGISCCCLGHICHCIETQSNEDIECTGAHQQHHGHIALYFGFLFGKFSLFWAVPGSGENALHATVPANRIMYMHSCDCHMLTHLFADFFEYKILITFSRAMRCNVKRKCVVEFVLAVNETNHFRCECTWNKLNF